MKRLIVIGFVIIVVIFLAVTCFNSMGGSHFGNNNPESTTQGAIEAMESRDANKVIGYFHMYYRPAMVRSMALLNSFDSIKINNVTVMKMKEEGLSAQVQATWDLLLTKNGVVSSQHYAKVIKLVKIEGKWYINEAF